MLFHGPLAQPVEHRTFNPLVVRSNRTRPTLSCNPADTYMQNSTPMKALHQDLLDRCNKLWGYL
jgi:hypothetical protein